ncbi:MAG: hypothetical protein KIY10_10785 [Thermoplasmata archaeon]|nr:hypothetical protein [Candidatus Sysuiplasma jiujiangense]
MEATDKPAAGRMAKLREELGRIAIPSAIPSRGRRGWSLDTEEEGRERRSDCRFLLFTTDTGSRRKRSSRRTSREMRWRRRSVR